MKITDDARDTMPPELLTAAISTEVETISCPSCFELLTRSQDECSACGVVISHFKRVSLEKRIKHTVGGLHHLSSHECETLDKAWRHVESFYYDSEAHNQFIHLCYRFKSLSFAAQKYVKCLEQDPLDEIADVMKKRVLILTEATAPAPISRPLPPSIATQGALRLFNMLLVAGVIAGVCLLMISGLTEEKMYFFGLGMFLIVSSVMSLLFMKNQINYY